MIPHYHIQLIFFHYPDILIGFLSLGSCAIVLTLNTEILCP
jgi:hypothetical protein